MLYNVSREKAMIIADAIRAGFAAAADEVEEHAVAATLSIGLVFNEEAVLDVPELLAQADQALYYAKERGRNRIEIASFDLIRQRRDATSPQLVAASAA